MEAHSGSLGSTRVFVGRWQNGEPGAFAELAARVAPLLRHRIRQRPGFRALADFTVDDVVQEVWADVLKAGSAAFTPSGRGSFSAWLGRIADRTLVDLCRRREAVKRGGGASTGPLDTMAELQARERVGEIAPPSPSAEARVSEFEALAGKVLNERELLAWRWVAIDGYTSEEAAFGLSCTPAAVRSLLVRSRRKLQEALGDEDDGG